MTANQAAISARELSKDFGNRSVLRRVQIEIPAGRCVALRGGNGSGKTTLLRCLAGLLRPTSGVVQWFGRPASGSSAPRHRIGMVAHETRLYPHLTLLENLTFAARMYGLPAPAQRGAHVLDAIGLATVAALRPTQISRGMQQRLALARALIHEPPVLLLDEPFAGLDAAGSGWLFEKLFELRQQGRTICFSSHDPATVNQLAHEVVELREGRLVRIEDPRQPMRAGGHTSGTDAVTGASRSSFSTRPENASGTDASTWTVLSETECASGTDAATWTGLSETECASGTDAATWTGLSETGMRVSDRRDYVDERRRAA